MADIIRDRQTATKTIESDSLFTSSAVIAVVRDETYTADTDAGIVVKATEGGGMYNNVLLAVNSNITVSNNDSAVVRGIDAVSTYTKNNQHSLYFSNSAKRATIKIARKTDLSGAALSIGLDVHKELDFSSGSGSGIKRFLTSFDISQTNTGDASAIAVRAEIIQFQSGFDSRISVCAKSSGGNADAAGFSGAANFMASTPSADSLGGPMSVSAQASASGKTASAALFRAGNGALELASAQLKNTLSITAKSASGGATATAFEAAGNFVTNLSCGLTVSATGNRAGVQTGDQVNAYAFHTTADHAMIENSGLSGKTSVTASNRSGKAGAYLFFAQGDGAAMLLRGQMGGVNVSANGASASAYAGAASEYIALNARQTGAVAVSAKSTAGNADAYGFSTTGFINLNWNIEKDITVSAAASGSGANAAAGAFYARQGIDQGGNTAVSGKIKVSASAKAGDAAASVFESNNAFCANPGQPGVTLGALTKDLTASATASGNASAFVVKSYDDIAGVGYEVGVSGIVSGKLTASAKGAGNAVNAAIVNSGADGRQFYSQGISGAVSVSASNTGAGSAFAAGFNGGYLEIVRGVSGSGTVSASAKTGNASAYYLNGVSISMSNAASFGAISVSASASDGRADASALRCTGAGGLDFVGDLNGRISVSAKSTNGAASALAFSSENGGISMKNIRKDIAVTANAGGAASASGLSGESEISLTSVAGKITVSANSKTASAAASGIAGLKVSLSSLTRDISVSASGVSSGVAANDVSTSAAGIAGAFSSESEISGKITVAAKDSGAQNGIVQSIAIGKSSKDEDLTINGTMRTAVSSTASNTGGGRAEAYGLAGRKLSSAAGDVSSRITVSASAKNDSVAAYGLYFSSISVNVLSGPISVKASGAGSSHGSVAGAVYADGGIMEFSTFDGSLSVTASSSKTDVRAFGFQADTLNVTAFFGDISISASGAETVSADAIYVSSLNLKGALSGKMTVTAKSSAGVANAYAVYAATSAELKDVSGAVTVSASGKVRANAWGFSSSSMIVSGLVSGAVKVTAKSSAGNSYDTTAYGWQAQMALNLNGGMSGNLTVNASASGASAAVAAGLSSSLLFVTNLTGKIAVSASGAAAVSASGMNSGEINISNGTGEISVTAKSTSTASAATASAAGLNATNIVTLNGGVFGKLGVSATAVSGGTANAAGVASTGSEISAESLTVSNAMTVSASGTAGAGAKGWSAFNGVSFGVYLGKTSVSASAKAGAANAVFSVSENQSIETTNDFFAAVTVKASGNSSPEAVNAYGFRAGTNIAFSGGFSGSLGVSADNASGASAAYGLLAGNDIIFSKAECGVWSVKTGKGNADSAAVGWSAGNQILLSAADASEGSVSAVSSTGVAIGISGTLVCSGAFSIDVSATGKTSAIALDLKKTSSMMLADCRITAKVTGGTESAYALAVEKDCNVSLDDGARLSGDVLFGGTDVSNGLSMFSGSGLTGDVDMTAGSSDTVELHSGSLLDGSIAGAEFINFFLDDAEQTGAVLRSDDLSGIAGSAVGLRVSSGLEGSFTVFSGRNGVLDGTTCFSNVDLNGMNLELNGAAAVSGDYEYSLRSDAKNSSVILDISVRNT